MGTLLMFVGLAWAALGIVAMGTASGVAVAVGAATFDYAVLMYLFPGLGLAGLGRAVQLVQRIADATEKAKPAPDSTPAAT